MVTADQNASAPKLQLGASNLAAENVEVEKHAKIAVALISNTMYQPYLTAGRWIGPAAGNEIYVPRRALYELHIER